MSNPNTAEGPREIPIKIENKPYKAPKSSMTGLELRDLADPKITPDRDLYLEVHGRGKDRLIGDQEAVALEPGMHFYIAPKTVNPGLC
jgi:hypothetical protein